MTVHQQHKEVPVLNYPATVLPMEKGEGFIVELADLPGCIADGDTVEEAMRQIELAAEEWIAAARELGREIPQPRSLDNYSGKWVQRVPKSLHMKLSAVAQKEGVSLNALAVALLAEGVGKRESA